MTLHYYPPKRKRTGLWVGLFIAANGVVLAIIACAGVFGFFSEEPQKAPATTPTPVVSSARVSVKPFQKPTVASIEEGMWLVGTDVPSGTYRTAGAAEGLFQFCTWTVRSGEGADSDIVDFNTSGKTNEPGRVVLKKGQVFETSGCQKWVKQ